MQIDKIETIPFSIPMKKPSHWGKAGYRDAAEGVLVRIYTDEGIVGTAEAIPRPYIYGETLFSIKNTLDQLLIPDLIGIDPFAMELMWEIMSRVAWNPSSKSAIDMALFDIKAQACKVPVYKFLGGYNNRVPVSYMVSLKPIPEMIEEAVKNCEGGIRTFKIKVGRELKKDIEVVTQLRKRLGEEVGLYVDANQGYSLLESLSFFRACEELGILCVEEPIPVYQKSARKKISIFSSVPIMGDDSCFTIGDVMQEVELGALGVINIKTSRTGYYQSQKITHLAEAAGIVCAIGSQGASGVGTLTAGHFAAASPAVKFPSELTSFLKHKDDLLIELPRIDDGFLNLSSKVGLGISIDEEKLKKYTIR